MKDAVKQYYGKILNQSSDLKTDACCTVSDPPGSIRVAMGNIHQEVASRYYGCGLVSPQAIEGARVLDLGCGSGQDCYTLAQLVGEQGEVVGVDMTQEQLEVAQRHLDWHRQRFGYAKSNVSFMLGEIERLHELELQPGSFDVIVSNCVINLSTDKQAVLEGALKLLKPGGELYFSDVYADRRVPAELAADPLLYGECLSGALYWHDFIDLAKQAGFADPRLVNDRPLALSHPEVIAKIGHIRFFSATYRLFKIAELESQCEDYGQAVVYRGGIKGEEQAFMLDKNNVIDKGRVYPVCGNSYRMLHQTRFKPYFEFIGNWDTHYGLFTGCGGTMPFDEIEPGAQEGGCC